MNAAWGYLEESNFAPVWIGEMGASLDGTNDDSAGASNLANEQAWAATIVGYLNGQDAAQGGPSVKTGLDWWTSGIFSGGAPDGYNSGPKGPVNAAQQAVVSQLLTYHPTAASTPAPIPAPTSGSPPPAAASANDMAVKAGLTAEIVDASGNKWTITSAGPVAVNGTADAATANVTELAYFDGSVWQENSGALWWGKTQPTASWSPGADTATSPLPTTITIAATQTSATVGLGQVSVVATAGAHIVFVQGAGDSVSLSGGTDTITDTGRNNTYVIPAAGKGYDTFTSNILTAGDSLDLRAALAATNRSGTAATLANYLKVANAAQGMVLSIAPTSGGAGEAIATINDKPATSLSTLLGHPLT